MNLDPVQIEALRFSGGKKGVGWFMEMGLGKTLCALQEFARARRGDGFASILSTRMIVVAPNSFKKGWVDEAEKHGFDFDMHIFVSGKKANDKWLEARYAKPPVLVINYEAIRSPDVLLKLMRWMRIKPTTLILDESIQIKTHDSQQTKAALALAREAVMVRLLSGRPQTQGPHDLYPQLKAIGLFQTWKFWAFRNYFCEMGGFEFKQVIGVKNAGELAKAMAPACFQAKKADWLPLMARKDSSIRTYEMSGEQLAQYKQMHDEFVLEMEDQTVAVRVAVAKYEKLSQIQCGFIIDEGKAVRELVRPDKNPRLIALLDTIDEISGKVIVIYRHRAVFDLLYLYGGFDCPAYIKGEMSPGAIERQKAQFNNDPDCRVLLGQCEATKYGHTLLGDQETLGDHCSTMIFFENSYSLDTRTQVEDRIHRRGQHENCLYIDLSASELDRRVVRALQKKEDLYTAVFSKLKAAEPA
jgi:hypothetical protein